MIKCPQCDYERTNNDDNFVSAEECPKCGIFYKKWKPSSVSPSTEPIITNSDVPDVKKERIITRKTEISRFNNPKYEAKKSAILIGLGVLSLVFGLVEFTNIHKPGTALSFVAMIRVMFNVLGMGMSRVMFNVLGLCLMVVGTVFGLRAIFYKKWKPSSVSKSTEPIVFVQNKNYSYKKEILKATCFVSIFCMVVLFVLPLLGMKFLHIFFDGQDVLFPIYLWVLLMYLVFLLSLIAMLGGLIFGIFVLCKKVIKHMRWGKKDTTAEFGISAIHKNEQEESYWLAILSCFIPIAITFMFFIVVDMYLSKTPTELSKMINNKQQRTEQGKRINPPGYPEYQSTNEYQWGRP